MDNLYEKKNYLNPIPYLFSDIREYDISKANINILFAKGIIDEDKYKYLYNLPRMDRQYTIGNMCKNKDIQDALDSGLIEFKKLFFETNDIGYQDVLSIKNDAIFLINKVPRFTSFGNVQFLEKNHYISYMKVFDTELYYSLNRVTGEEKIDVKGISDEKLEKYHLNYMLDFLCYIFNTIQTDGIDKAINDLHYFYNNYVSRKLDIGYYREFNAMSLFRISINITNRLVSVNPQLQKDIGLEYVNDNDEYRKYINISYNMNYLRTIWSYLTSIHYDKRI